jgi:AbrB family looped-hinge helix DNA binding protein
VNVVILLHQANIAGLVSGRSLHHSNTRKDRTIRSCHSSVEQYIHLNNSIDYNTNMTKIQSFVRKNGSEIHSVTIPKNIVEDSGISKGSQVEFFTDKDKNIIIKKAL